MKKKLSFLLNLITLLFVLSTVEMSSNLFAQSWTTIDGGATYGISSTTSSNSNFPSVAVLNGGMYAIWQEYTKAYLKSGLQNKIQLIVSSYMASENVINGLTNTELNLYTASGWKNPYLCV